jgi:hypothetical protein
MKKTFVIAAASLFAAGAMATGVGAQTTGSPTGTLTKTSCKGVNACKGQSACKSSANACKGQNDCKGKGWAMTTTALECTVQGGSPGGG